MLRAITVVINKHKNYTSTDPKQVKQNQFKNRLSHMNQTFKVQGYTFKVEKIYFRNSSKYKSILSKCTIILSKDKRILSKNFRRTKV